MDLRKRARSHASICYDPRWRALGRPEATVDYREGYSAWFYSVRVWPWRAIVAYYVTGDRVLDFQVGEGICFWSDPTRFKLPASRLDGVQRFIVETDPHPWVVLPSDDHPVAEEPHSYGRWTPIDGDMRTVIDGAFDYLMKLQSVPKKDQPNFGVYSRDDLMQILIHRSSYVCQVVGYTVDGKKMIHLNFFPPLRYLDDYTPGSAPGWHTSYVSVMGGGHNFWHIEYDPTTKTFSHFEVNGPM